METAASMGNVDDAAISQGRGGEGVAAPPNFNGLWAEANGAVVPFGSARSHGQDDQFLGISVQGAGPSTAINPPPTPTFAGIASTPDGQGYWLLTAYGHVLAYDAPYYGSADFKGATRPYGTETITTPRAAAGLAPTDGGKGYVVVARDGTTARFGKAPSCSLPAGVSVAGVAPDYRTGGYWVATTNGHVYACQAPSYPYKTVAGTVTGIAALGNGLGYRLVTSNGKVYDYGAAVWHGDPN